MTLSRIAWEAKATGFKGGGTWREYRPGELEVAITVLNYGYPEIHHWIETWTRRGN